MADLKFLYHPTLDIARSITEIHPYLEYLAAVRCKRQCVLLVVNLLQSLFRSAVQFEFHYINVLVGLQYKVYPALRSVILRFYIETHQFENDEEHILIVQLQFFHQFVGSIGKETLQAAEESIGLSSLYFLYKLLYFKRCFNLVETCIVRYEESNKTFFHLTIGKAETINSKTFIIPLYREITALENYGQRL